MNAIALVGFGLLCYSVSGVVEDPAGLALPCASVVVEDTRLGTSTDESGSFRVEVPDSIEKGTLTVSYIGYAETRSEFSRDERSVRVVLKPKNIAMEGVDVSGDHSLSHTEGIGAKTALDQMGVYATPGASADLFHTLKTLPAFSGEADIASIAIRGGSPQEVLIALNGLPLKHPFLYYQSTGGLFSLVEENSLQTIEAFPGPLPPAYGGGMSGGVLLGTRSVFDPRLSIGLSMANATLTRTHPATGGMWFSRSYYDRLASKLSLSDEAVIFPSFWTLQWMHRAQLGLFHVAPLALIARSRTELDLSDLGYEVMNDGESNEILCMSGGCVAEHWTVESTVGYSRYRCDYVLRPVVEKYRDERNYYSRASITYHVSTGSALMIGGEVGKDYATVRGTYDSSGTRDTFRLQVDNQQEAAFAAHRFSFGCLTAIYGFRPVRQHGRIVSLDPRCLTEIELNEMNRLRLSAGRMSQYLSFDDTVTHYADQFACGIEKQSSIGKLNLDVYCKRYKSGGQALGIEGLLRFHARGTESWIGFALMDARGKDGVALDHDVPARLMAVLNIPVRSWALGLNCHWAVGRPYTPLASTRDSAGITLPVWYEENSARLPNVFRLNCRIARLFRIADYPLFFFLEGYNLTDYENVTSYCYSPNYEKRKPIVLFPRMIYLGIVITL